MVGRQDPQCHCRHHDGIQTSRKQDVDIVGVVLRNEKNERRVPDVAKNGVRIRHALTQWMGAKEFLFDFFFIDKNKTEIYIY